MFLKVFLFVATCLQAVNLLVHLLIRLDVDKRDRRLTTFRKSEWARLFFFVVMGAMAFCYCLPTTILSSVRPQIQPTVRRRDVVGAVMWVIGFVMEVMANNQLFVFTHNPRNYGKICNKGISFPCTFLFI